MFEIMAELASATADYYVAGGLSFDASMVSQSTYSTFISLLNISSDPLETSGNFNSELQ